MNPRRSVVLATMVVCLVAVGCDDEPSSGSADGTPIDADTGNDLTLDVPDEADSMDSGDMGEDVEDAGDVIPDITGPVVTVIFEGSLDDRTPDDGLAAQTPDPYYIGVQKLELLRSNTDPSPVVIFDYAPEEVLVDLHDTNVVARLAIDSLPTGTFRQIRFTLTIVEAEVMTTLHQVPVLDTLRTPVHLVYALSDVEIDGVELDQGDALATISIAGTTATMPGHWDVVYPAPGPSGALESIDGVTYLTARLPEPLNVSPGASDDLTYGLRFFIYNSFRWQDQDEPEFTEDEWDVTVDTPPVIEPVLRFGANDFETFME